VPVDEQDVAGGLLAHKQSLKELREKLKEDGKGNKVAIKTTAMRVEKRH